MKSVTKTGDASTEKKIDCFFPYSCMFGYTYVWQVICYFWCGMPFHSIVFHSVQFGVSVLLAQHLTTWSFSHKCQMIKYLHLKYIAFDFILRTLCGFLRLSNIRQTSFDLAIKRIIYHFWKLFFFKKQTNWKAQLLTGLHHFIIYEYKCAFWQSLRNRQNF